MLKYFVIFVCRLQLWPLDFPVLTKNEPFYEPLHCLFVYPLIFNFIRKRTLFMRFELLKNDVDIRKNEIEVGKLNSVILYHML